MIRILCSALLLAALLAPHPGHAAFIKRDFLLRTCGSTNDIEVADCTGYIAGIADAGPPSGASVPPFCVPDRVPIRNLRETVMKFLQSHRGQPDGDGAQAVREALISAFPCGHR